NYNVIVKGACKNDTSDFVTLTVKLTPTAVAMSNSPICIGDSIVLSATTVTGANYSWTSTTGYSSALQNPIILSSTTANAGSYSLTVTVNGCTSTPSTILVVVNDCNIDTSSVDFFIPEGFSPNGDGINDLFVIRGILNFPNNNFTIFNRWGNKVFESSPYQNTWDGKCTTGLYIGKDLLPTGTYFYLLDLKDGTKVFKGTIYLNK
ncbi:MAG: gliding motility-associated C-terminal domain-containing protein, partial [Crocinitomicaceae bacterium]